MNPQQALRKRQRPSRPDLQTQLESLLDQVWRCEGSWRLDDRIALAVRVSSTQNRQHPL